jgi:hypothetical protein
MIRRGNYNGINVLLFLIEHPAEISIPPRAAERFKRMGGILVIDIAQGHDVL